MCTFATRLVSLLLLLTVSAPNAVAQEADEETVVRRASESWDVIRTYFDPPASFANEFSAHRSPLLFDNGSDVHTAADWKRRRTELLDRWTKMSSEPTSIPPHHSQMSSVHIVLRCCLTTDQMFTRLLTGSVAGPSCLIDGRSYSGNGPR